MEYFLGTYEECRFDFLKICKSLNKKYKDAKVESYNIRSAKDGNLFMDTFLIPARKEFKNLIIISSGVHGVEGFAGSAVQRMFLKEMLDGMDLDDTGIFMIHSINPFGHKYGCRVNENSIDLNRNFIADKDIFLKKNAQYSEIYSVLNPEGKYSDKPLKRLRFFIKAFSLLFKYKKGVLMQAVLQGQYEHEKGIFFGGKQLEEQALLLRDIINKQIQPYKKIFAVDLHTGYGKRGRLHLFKSNDVIFKDLNEYAEMIFKGFKLEGGNPAEDKTEFYTAYGSFAEFIFRISDKKICLPVVFEFGTMNSHKLPGRLRSLEIMIDDNQAFHFGCRREKDRAKLQRRFREMYYPASRKWRKMVIEQGRSVLKVFIKRFKEI